MKYIFLSIFAVLTNLYGLTLKEILELQKQDNKTKSIESLRDAKIAHSELFNTYDAPRLGASVAEAEELTQKGLEYTVNFSQNIANPFESDEKRKLSENLSKVAKQESEHLLHIRELDIAAKYYASCSAKALQEQSQMLLEEHIQRAKRVDEAYKLGEISKKALLFSKLELIKSQQNRREYQRVYSQEFGLLQESVPELALESLSCSDIVEPKRDLVLSDVSAHAELQTLEYKRNAASAQERLYEAAFQNIGYELAYEDELATKRYRFGINIPLTAFSSQNRLNKESALQEKLSLGYAKESLAQELAVGVKKQRQRVQALYDEYLLARDEMLPLTEELLELSEYAYQEGEGGTLEYLEASRSFRESTIETLELKKRYYYELFELYKITDTHFGEEICTK